MREDLCDDGECVYSDPLGLFAQYGWGARQEGAAVFL